MGDCVISVRYKYSPLISNCHNRINNSSYQLKIKPSNLITYQSSESLSDMKLFIFGIIFSIYFFTVNGKQNVSTKNIYSFNKFYKTKEIKQNRVWCLQVQISVRWNHVEVWRIVQINVQWGGKMTPMGARYAINASLRVSWKETFQWTVSLKK